MNRGELQLALRAIKARKHREQMKLLKEEKDRQHAEFLKKKELIAKQRYERKHGGSNKLSSSLKAMKSSRSSQLSARSDAMKSSRINTQRSTKDEEDVPATTGRLTTRTNGTYDAMETDRMRQMLEDEEIEETRVVAKAGMSLRELIAKKREEDAWFRVYGVQLKEQEEREQAKLKKIEDEKVIQSNALKVQLERKQALKKKLHEEKLAYQAKQKEDQARWKIEMQVKQQEKQARQAKFRADFRKDIDIVRARRQKEKNRKILSEKKDMMKARALAEEEVLEKERKKKEAYVKLKETQDENIRDLQRKANLKALEAEEDERINKEYIRLLEKEDRERHRALDEIFKKQAMKEATFKESTQEIINKQLAADEARAVAIQEAKNREMDRLEQEKIDRRKEATRQQIAALELEKKLQAEKKERIFKEERRVALELIKQDLDMVKKDKMEQQEAKSKRIAHRELLQQQIAQDQERKRTQYIGGVEPYLMAINKRIFKEAGFKVE